MSEVTAKEIKQLYVRRRRQLHAQYKPASRWDLCWQKIADRVNELKCDPADYIEAQFLYRYPFPHPNTMYSRRALDVFEVFQKEHRQGKLARDFLRSFEFMTELLESRVGLGFSTEEVLLTQAHPFTALFRVAMGRFLGVPAGKLEAYEEEAQEEYGSHPELRKIYRDYMEGNT